MLWSFEKSRGKAFFCANAAVYDHLANADQALPWAPKQDGVSHRQLTVDVADYFFRDLTVFLKELSDTFVTNGTDKAVLVRIYTQALTQKVQSALGDSDAASVIRKALEFKSGMSDLASDDATTAMSVWRKNAPTIDDLKGSMTELSLAAILGMRDAVKQLLEVRDGLDLKGPDLPVYPPIKLIINE